MFGIGTSFWISLDGWKRKRRIEVGQFRKRGGVWWIRYCRNGRRIEESARTDK